MAAAVSAKEAGMESMLGIRFPVSEIGGFGVEARASGPGHAGSASEAPLL
jgi:hypothetical protein